jgi:hypothetical protein
VQGRVRGPTPQQAVRGVIPNRHNYRELQGVAGSWRGGTGLHPAAGASTDTSVPNRRNYRELQASTASTPTESMNRQPHHRTGIAVVRATPQCRSELVERDFNVFRRGADPTMALQDIGGLCRRRGTSRPGPREIWCLHAPRKGPETAFLRTFLFLYPTNYIRTQTMRAFSAPEPRCTPFAPTTPCAGHLPTRYPPLKDPRVTADEPDNGYAQNQGLRRGVSEYTQKGPFSRVLFASFSRKWPPMPSQTRHRCQDLLGGHNVRCLRACSGGLLGPL